MELAEAAHREALRDLQPPAQRRPSPAAHVQIPGLPTPPAGRDATFGTLFTKLARCVRQAILLEARLAAGAYDHPLPGSTGPRSAAEAQPAFSQTVPAQPASARPDRAPADPRPEQVEDDMAADIARSAPEILASDCQELGAALDAGCSIPGTARAAAGPPCKTPRYHPLTAMERSAELAERSRPRPAPA